MLKAKKHWGIFALYFAMFFLSLTLFGGSGISLEILGVSPILVISLLIPFSGYASVTSCAVTGFLCGAAADSIAADSYCFNTVALLLLAVGGNLLASFVFNRNAKACVTLCFLLTLAYYIFYWLIFIAFSLDFSGNLAFLLQWALPSALYTAVLSLPFYFIFKFTDKYKNQS